MASAELTMRITPTNAPSDKVTLDLSGTTVTIPALEVARLFLEKVVTGSQAEIRSAPTSVPAIGEPWPAYFGIYAGIVRGDKGQPDYHLIVLEQHDGDLSWKDATAWAPKLKIEGAGLPKRKEQAVLFGNVSELFDKSWYWSCEQYAGDGEYAWSQHFYYGTQDGYRKSYQLRARAVRRVPIR